MPPAKELEFFSRISVQTAADSEADTPSINRTTFARGPEDKPCKSAICQANPRMCKASERSRGCNPCAYDAEECSVVDLHMARTVADKMHWAIDKSEKWVANTYRPQAEQVSALKEPGTFTQGGFL